jgi:hypothetical protein
MPVAPVTLLDVFAKQVEMGAQLAIIHEQLRTIPDHEARIRVLEAAHSKVFGAAVVLGALAGGGAGWIALAIARH